jgi:hypothetical protein
LSRHGARLHKSAFDEDVDSNKIVLRPGLRKFEVFEHVDALGYSFVCCQWDDVELLAWTTLLGACAPRKHEPVTFLGYEVVKERLEPMVIAIG